MRNNIISLLLILVLLISGCSTTTEHLLNPFGLFDGLIAGSGTGQPEQKTAPPSPPENRNANLSSVVPARPPAELNYGLQAFQECRFEQAVELLDAAAGYQLCPDRDKARALLYSGASHYYLGRIDQARLRFQRALDLWPDLEASRWEFTPEVRSLFDSVRTSR